MQQRIALVLALLVVPVSSSASTLTAAKAWLQSHEAPNQDELGELQSANPEAYSLVKALLTKRSMGLLTKKLPAEDQGPAVFQRMMSSHPMEADHAATNAAVAYAGVGATQHDWVQWNPEDSAKKDETMVSSLLSAVAQLKGKKVGFLTKHSHVEEDPFESAAAEFGVELHPTEAPKQAVPAVAAVQEQDDDDSQQNSYLKGLDLTGDMPAHKSQKKHAEDHHNYLLGDMGTFDDEVKVMKAQEVPATPAPQAKPEPPKNEAFMAWLGLVKKAPAPKVVEAPVAAPVEPAKPHNAYITDLLD